jgi:hypothetical protein
MPFGLNNVPPTSNEYGISRIHFMFLNDFSVFSDLKTHLAKFWLCFDKCREFNINLNSKKCMFLVHSGVIFEYVVSKVGKLFHSKNISTIVNMPAPKTPKYI